jgi:hypothetical protein
MTLPSAQKPGLANLASEMSNSLRGAAQLLLRHESAEEFKSRAPKTPSISGKTCECESRIMSRIRKN